MGVFQIESLGMGVELDGHAVLSRELAGRGQYPALDPLDSVSRLMPQVVDENHQALARTLRARLAAYKDAEDLIMLGAYRSGSNADVDAALRSREQTLALLAQRYDEGSTLEQTRELMQRAVDGGREESA